MYSIFQVTGMIKGFFGFEIFDSRIFLGRKSGKYFFVWLDLSGDLVAIFWGIQNNLKYIKYNQTCLAFFCNI